MNKFRFFSLIFIIIGLSLPNKALSEDNQDAPVKMTTSESFTTIQDEDAPVEMTTSESFTTIQDAIKNCSSHDTCEDCINASCYWLDCLDEDYCDDSPMETCKSVAECKNTTTTTQAPTTTVPPDTTTSEEPTTVTTDIPTTTDNTTTTTPSTTTSTTSTTPSTTTSATTTTNATTTTTPASTTTSPATTSTTTEAPHRRHFDAGSFVGGMILALTLTAVAFAGWKFYRRRALSTSYTNLTESLHI